MADEKALTMDDFREFGRKGGLKSWYSKTDEQKKKRVEELKEARIAAAEKRRLQEEQATVDNNL